MSGRRTRRRLSPAGPADGRRAVIGRTPRGRTPCRTCNGRTRAAPVTDGPRATPVTDGPVPLLSRTDPVPHLSRTDPCRTCHGRTPCRTWRTNAPCGRRLPVGRSVGVCRGRFTGAGPLIAERGQMINKQSAGQLSRPARHGAGA